MNIFNIFLVILLVFVISPLMSSLFLCSAGRRIIFKQCLKNDGDIRICEWNLLSCTFQLIDDRGDFFYFKTPAFPVGFILEIFLTLYNLYEYIRIFLLHLKYENVIECGYPWIQDIDQYKSFFDEHNQECIIHNRLLRSICKDNDTSEIFYVCISNEAKVLFKLINNITL